MVTLKKTGGEMVGMGIYWNLANDERVRFGHSGFLPGSAEVCYYMSLPTALIVAGPVLGLVYAMLLPFIGIAMLLSMVAKRLFGGLLQSAYRGATFGWEPGEAFLAGKKGRSGRTISKKEEE